MLTEGDLLSKFEAVRARSNGSGGWMARCPCPSHPDNTASLSIRRMSDGWSVKCFAGCDNADVLAAINLRKADLFDDGRERPPQRPKPPPKPKVERAGLLAGYAADKDLPIQFLLLCGLCDVTRESQSGHPYKAIEIPYFTLHGQEGARRYRLKPGSETRFLWETGSIVSLYGLDRLIGYGAKRAAVTLCEGESDCHCLWFAGIPAIGLPGVANWNESRDAHLFDAIPVIYIAVEDARGKAAILDGWLPKSAIRHRTRLIFFEPDAKDPSAVYLDAPARFEARWAAMCKAAVPWTETEQGKAERAAEIDAEAKGAFPGDRAEQVCEAERQARLQQANGDDHGEASPDSSARHGPNGDARDRDSNQNYGPGQDSRGDGRAEPRAEPQPDKPKRQLKDHRCRLAVQPPRRWKSRVCRWVSVSSWSASSAISQRRRRGRQVDCSPCSLACAVALGGGALRFCADMAQTGQWGLSGRVLVRQSSEDDADEINRRLQDIAFSAMDRRFRHRSAGKGRLWIVDLVNEINKALLVSKAGGSTLPKPRPSGCCARSSPTSSPIWFFSTTAPSWPTWTRTYPQRRHQGRQPSGACSACNMAPPSSRWCIRRRPGLNSAAVARQRLDRLGQYRARPCRYDQSSRTDGRSGQGQARAHQQEGQLQPAWA
jgi:hypothetical protein